MPNPTEELLTAYAGRIDAATTAIAERIRLLKEKILNETLSPQQIVDLLEAEAVTLEAMGQPDPNVANSFVS